jgi:hypothetical protein
MERRLKSFRVTVAYREGTAPTVTQVLTRWPLMRLASREISRAAEQGAIRVDVDEVGGEEPDGVLWVAATYQHDPKRPITA